MNEVRSGVISYAAAPESQRRVAEVQRARTGKAYIDRFRLHMKTMLRHARGVRSKILIACRRAVSADDVDLGVGPADGAGSIRHDVEKPRIKVVHLAGAVIAEEVVELRESLGNVSIAMAIDDIQAFSGMGVIEPQASVLSQRGSDARGRDRRGCAE